MGRKRLSVRRPAKTDIQIIVNYLIEESGLKTALRFLEKLYEAVELIRDNPGIGSPRYAHLLGMENLRSWALPKFPYLIFYLETETSVEIWHVLHGSSAIPDTLKP